MALSFIITGSVALHGQQTPVVVFNDGATCVLVNPAILGIGDVIGFANQLDAMAAAANLRGCRLISIDTANPDLLAQVMNPVVSIPVGL